MSELSVGARVLQRYRVTRQLGRGGMGVVYLGRTEGAAGFSRPVVIKQLHAALAERRELNEMFAREARILGSLQHPNIVNVIDFGIENSSYVMVLEYVHGYDLDQWLRLVSQTRGQVNYEHGLYIARKVLAGLQHAHEAVLPDGTPASIVHRDVSLSNVLLDTAAQVKLHDFGIARIEDGSELLTQAGVFKGKLAMAAPEQLRGEQATRRSDIYSTAVMTYQLLAGSNPFRGQSEAETIFRIDQHVPPPLSSLRGDVPIELDAVLGRALQKVPDARFESAAKLAEQLAALGSRSDALILSELERQLGEDFAILPQVLGLESLAVRDAAWRDLGDVRAGSPSPVTPLPAEISAPSARFKPFVLPLSAGAAALVALALTAGRNPHTPPAPGYLLVDPLQATAATDVARAADVGADAAQPSGGEPVGPAAEGQASAVTAGIEEPKPPYPIAGAARRSIATPRQPNAAELTLQFRAHQAEVESCFRRYAEPLGDAGRVSLRFEVARTGTVTRVSVSPDVIAARPLGRCLLQVAGTARFGHLSEPVAFSIPITTRREEGNK